MRARYQGSETGFQGFRVKSNVRGECAQALSELGNGLLRLALEISVLRSRVSGLAFKL